MVAIRAVQGDGIIAHAKNARDNYSKAQIEETIKLLQYKAQLDTMGDNSLLTLEQINDQEWIKDETAIAMQDEATGKITITIAKTGEQIEVEGKKPGPEGTYYWVGLNVKEFFSLTLKDNNRFEQFVKGYDTDPDEHTYGTYEYNANTKKIKLIYDDEDWGDDELDYMTLENNKVLYEIIPDFGCNGEDWGKRMFLCTTNGTEGFQIPENGIYEGTSESGTKYEYSINNGVISNTTKYSEKIEGLGIIWDNVIYRCLGEKECSVFKISGDNFIGYDSSTEMLGVVFTKTGG